MIEQAPCGLMKVAEDGRILEANDVLHDYLGVAPGRLTGRSLASILAPAARVIYQMQALPQLTVTGRVDELHLTLRQMDGTDVPVLISAVVDASRNPPETAWSLRRMAP
jgi:PAS domain S-box-containing protein